MNNSYPASKSKQSSQITIDYRSDTVTQPCEKMRQCMAEAPVGDDVYAEDPSVNLLQQKAADLLNKEAGLFVPSGTMSNLLALMTHCQRGEEVIVGDQNHIFSHEAGGASVLGSIVMQSIPTTDKGYVTAQQIEQAVRPNDSHFAPSKLVCLENTVSGFIQPQDEIDNIIATARYLNLKTHLDGARLMHAAVEQNLPASRLCKGFDSVSLCLSKGLGAPAGSVLLGDQNFINKATRLRKMLGGGMRQAGILAAAGIYSLANNIDRLKKDHVLTRYFADQLKQIKPVKVVMNDIETNMIFVSFPLSESRQDKSLADYLLEHEICIGAEKTCRIVIHLDICQADVDKTLECIRSYYS